MDTGQQLRMSRYQHEAFLRLATLGRGYAILQTPDRRVVRSVLDVAPGDRLEARLADGTLAYWAPGALTCSDPYCSPADLAAVVAVLHRRQGRHAASGALALQAVNKA